MGRQATANVIINRAALEVGLLPSNDAVASSDKAFVQLTGLLTSAGQELVELQPWQVLRKAYQVVVGTTTAKSSGVYALPADFAYMIDQTGWDRTNNVPMFGPLTPQGWTYLEGRDLVSSTIYAQFRLDQNCLELYPKPPPDGTDINFEYISRNWVQSTDAIAGDQDEITIGSDIVLFEPILMVKFLKVKFLEAKGMDANAARLELENMFLSRRGKDTGAGILNAGQRQRDFPYIDPIYNLGDTGYGT